MSVKHSLTIFALLFLVLMGCQRSDFQEALAANGAMDFSGWNVSLDDNCAFYCGELLAPDLFGVAEPIGYYAVPSY